LPLFTASDVDAASSACDLWSGIDDSDNWSIFRESFDSTTQDSSTSGFASTADLSALCIDSSSARSSTHTDISSPTSSVDFLMPSINTINVTSDAFAVPPAIPEAYDSAPLLPSIPAVKWNNPDAVVSRIPTPPDITPFLSNSFKVPATFTFSTTVSIWQHFNFY
jgi:hypothetical protein